MMSNGENSNDKSGENTEGVDKNIESGKNALAQVTSSLLELKGSSPKVFYGGLGGIGVLILAIMIMSSGDGTISTSGPTIKELVIGKTYVLRTPNAYDENATIRLVGAPGALEAYDDTEKADRTGCKHLRQGTRVVVEQLSDAFGKKNAFAKVTVEAGECQGKSNWTSTINVHEK